MNIIIDDDLQNRITPNGFTRFSTGNDLIDFIEGHPKFKVENITFDNDLGTGLPEGYDIVKVLIENEWQVENFNLHTANVVAQRNMAQILQSAMRHEIIPYAPISMLPLIEYATQF